jgi:hypothetical protein
VKWTREKPTKPGFYWLRRQDDDDIVIRLWRWSTEEFSVAFTGTDYDRDLGEVDGLWAGPLTTDDIQEE